MAVVLKPVFRPARRRRARPTLVRRARNRAVVEIFVLAASLMLGAAGSLGQGGAAPPQAPGTSLSQNPTSLQLAPGTIVQAELSKSLDAKRVKPGDKIQAKISIALLAHGHVVIPADTKIIGHITGAKAHSKQSPDSKIEFLFDHFLLKGGRELPVHFSVQSIGRPLVNLPQLSGPEAMNDASISMPPGGAPGQAGAMGTTSRSASNPVQPQPFPADNPAASTDGPLAQPSTSPLGPTSQGVIGIKGLTLSNSPQGSVVNSSSQNVHLDGGAQLILRVEK